MGMHKLSESSVNNLFTSMFCSSKTKKEVNMFKSIISILILAGGILSLLPLAGFSQVYVIGPAPWWVNDGNISTAKLRGISVVDSQVVFVVGEKGKVYERTGTVHQHTWGEKNNGISAEYNLNDVCFVNASVGWVVGEKDTEPDKYKGVIYKTTNSGGGWIDQTGNISPMITLPTPFIKVQMINTNYGYISCGNGMVLKTEDGGSHWNRKKTPWADSGHPQDSIQVWYNGLWVNPNNANDLWVTGDAYGLMSHSVNGGDSWTVTQPSVFYHTYHFPDSTYTPFPTRLATYDLYHNVSSNEGMIALSYGKLGHTTDGGSTWNVIQLEPPDSSPIWFKDVAYNDSEWLACGNFGVVDRYALGIVTQENANYKRPYERDNINFNCIDFDSLDYIYAAGSGNSSVWQRYDPGAIKVNVQMVDSANRINVYIKIEPLDSLILIKNFKNWYWSTRWVKEHLWGILRLDPRTSQITTYEDVIDPANTLDEDIYYEIYLKTWDYIPDAQGIQEVALVKIHPFGLNDTFIPPSPLTVQTRDKPDDQGLMYQYQLFGNTTMNWYDYVIHDTPWSNDSNHYWQNQFNHVPDGNWHDDTTVQNGRTYTSQIFRIRGDKNIGYLEQSTPTVTIVDNCRPDSPVFVDTRCQYDTATHTVKLVWKMENPANNPDIAGYWVCPIPPDSSRHHYRLAHSAPISRTICRLPVDTSWIGSNAIYYVAAMDYSGHISDWSESLGIYIGSSIAMSNSSQATAYNNGRKLVRLPDTDELWTTYESDNKVYAARSTDAGGTWTKMLVGYGHFPVLSYDKNAEPIIPTLVWQGQIESGAPVIFFSRYTGNNTWTNPTSIQTGSVGASFGPTSFAIGIGDTGHVAYEENTGSSSIKYTKFNIYNPNPGLPQTVGTGTSPSIGYMSSTGKPPIHVAWVNNNTIYYRSRSAAGWALTETVSGTLSSIQPSLEVGGNNAYVVWAENTSTGDIYWRYKVYTGMYGLWMATKRVCTTGSTASTYPELTGGYTCTWVEQGTTNFEVYYTTYNESSGQWNTPVNISDNSKEELFSNYPHLTYKQTVNGTMLYFVWTEGSEALRTAPPYKIKFKSKELIQGKSLVAQPLPYYIAYGGEEDPSPFNRKRDGYEQYGDEPCKRIDKANSFLEYQFETLDPNRIYDLTAYLYQRGSTNLNLKAKIDNILLGTITLPPDTVVMLNHNIPAALYNDNTVNLKIYGNNNQAVSAILALHEFEPEDVKGYKQAKTNGPQEIGSKPVVSYQLSLTVQPTPMAKSLSIRYTLPQKGHVRISLYDVSGRLVQNLVDESLKPGAYTIKRDNTDLGLSRGVYFVRLETNNQTLVQKAIVVK
jgi:photosystem II stability/assembly factor-like uncharacterized protein